MNTKALLTTSALLFALAANAEWPPLTNCIPITSNLIFRLDSWASDVPPLQFRPDEQIHRTLSAINANHVHYRAIPWDKAFEFKLLDEQGREVAKTKRGQELSQPVPVIDSTRKFFACKPQAVFGDDIRAFFRPDELFIITNKGSYLLEVRIRMLVPMTNGLPDVKAMSSGGLSDLVTNAVFVSAPARVKVIKE